jgi:Holliday junction DNA helicase RuvA
MIVSIRGKILKKTPNEIIIEVNGLGYLCFITINTYDKLGKLGEEVSLLTYFQVSENSNALFAFHNETEKHLFEMLISVSGIGPKTAINLLSAVTPDEFKRRLIAGEVVMLTALPGIGPKTARRIIVELKDKFVDISKDDLPKEGDMSGVSGDAYDALLALGFQAKDIRGSILKVTSKQQDLSTEEIIKQTLSELR